MRRTSLAYVFIVENRYVRNLRGCGKPRTRDGVTLQQSRKISEHPYADAFTRCSLPRREFPTSIIVGLLTTPHGEMPALLEIVFRLICAYRFSLLPCAALRNGYDTATRCRNRRIAGSPYLSRYEGGAAISEIRLPIDEACAKRLTGSLNWMGCASKHVVIRRHVISRIKNSPSYFIIYLISILKRPVMLILYFKFYFYQIFFTEMIPLIKIFSRLLYRKYNEMQSLISLKNSAFYNIITFLK